MIIDFNRYNGGGSGSGSTDLRGYWNSAVTEQHIESAASITYGSAVTYADAAIAEAVEGKADAKILVDFDKTPQADRAALYATLKSLYDGGSGATINKEYDFYKTVGPKQGLKIDYYTFSGGSAVFGKVVSPDNTLDPVIYGQVLTIDAAGNVNVVSNTVGGVDLSGYYNSAQTENAITSKGYVTSGQVKSQVEAYDYATVSQIPTVPTSNTAFTNDAGYITDAAIADFVTSADVKTQVEDYHYVNSGDVKSQVEAYDYATVAQLPVVPTSNTAFTNDAKYVNSAETKTQIEDYHYVNSADVKTQVEEYHYVVSGDVKSQVEAYEYVNSGQVETQILAKNYLTADDIEPDLIYSGDPGFYAINSSALTTWQIENLDLSNYNFVRFYIKASDIGFNSSDNFTAPMYVDVVLDPKSLSSQYQAYLGVTTNLCAGNRNRSFTTIAAVDITKSKVQVLYEVSLWDVSVSNAAANGRYCYKIEGYKYNVCGAAENGGGGEAYTAGANISISPANVISVSGLSTINGSAITAGGNLVIDGGESGNYVEKADTDQTLIISTDDYVTGTAFIGTLDDGMGFKFDPATGRIINLYNTDMDENGVLTGHINPRERYMVEGDANYVTNSLTPVVLDGPQEELIDETPGAVVPAVKLSGIYWNATDSGLDLNPGPSAPLSLTIDYGAAFHDELMDEPVTWQDVDLGAEYLGDLHYYAGWNGDEDVVMSLAVRGYQYDGSNYIAVSVYMNVDGTGEGDWFSMLVQDGESETKYFDIRDGYNFGISVEASTNDAGGVTVEFSPYQDDSQYVGEDGFEMYRIMPGTDYFDETVVEFDGLKYWNQDDGEWQDINKDAVKSNDDYGYGPISKIVKLTQDDYDDLDNNNLIDPDTLYIIIPDPNA